MDTPVLQIDYIHKLQRNYISQSIKLAWVISKKLRNVTCLSMSMSSAHISQSIKLAWVKSNINIFQNVLESEPLFNSQIIYQIHLVLNCCAHFSAILRKIF